MDFKDIFKKKKKTAGAGSAEADKGKPVQKAETAGAETPVTSDSKRTSRSRLASEPKTIKKDGAAPKAEIAELGKEKPVKPAKRMKNKTPKIASRILAVPRITEKAMALAEQNQYVFKVFKSANKIEVKQAVNEVYGVEVEKMRIVNIPRKQRRLGKIKGWKQGYKKAIITVKKGQKIDIV